MEQYFQINEKGHNIRCKLYCTAPQNIRMIVIFCHGFGGHKDNAAAEKFARRMLAGDKSAALVTFNWPCHGDDVKKKLDLEDCGTYLDLVIRFVRQKYREPALYAYATSFGGYLTLKYVAENGNPFRRIALRCPAVNMYEVLTRAIMKDEELDRLKKGKSVPVGFDRKIPVSQHFLQQLQEKDVRKADYLDYAEDMLILQGTADEIVPYEAVFDFAQEQLIGFTAVEAADHRFRDPRCMDLAIKQILAFFRETRPEP